MLITKVEKGNIERALSSYKYKVNKTKQIKKLRDQREHTKPSVLKRKKMQKAKYIQQKFDQNDNL